MKKYDYEKAIQVINYLICSNENKRLDKISIIKLLFFSDKYHLCRYGRLICNHAYFAMKHGPVQSEIRDIFNDLSNNENEYIYVKNNDVISKQTPDLDELSDSDIEALDFNINLFRTIGGWELVDLTHSCIEWSKHQSFLETGSRKEMNMKDLFEISNVKDLKLKQLFEETSKYINYAQEVYREDQVIDSLMYG